MGCTESLPAPDSFDVQHKQVDKDFMPIGSHVGGGPSTVGPTRIIVKEKLFSWSDDDFGIKQYPSRAPFGNGLKIRIKQYPSRVPFGNGLKIKGKVFAMHDQITLVDGNGKMVAFCLRKFELVGQAFKIYVLNPRFPDQKKSNQNHNGRAPLYTYCEVKRMPFSMRQEVFMDGKGVPEFAITRAGGMWTKKRLVKRRGIPAALMEGGTWEGDFNSYHLTINPGIDPCLIVCICAICDEMDELNSRVRIRVNCGVASSLCSMFDADSSFLGIAGAFFICKLAARRYYANWNTSQL